MKFNLDTLFHAIDAGDLQSVKTLLGNLEVEELGKILFIETVDSEYVWEHGIKANQQPILDYFFDLIFKHPTLTLRDMPMRSESEDYFYHSNLFHCAVIFNQHPQKIAELITKNNIDIDINAKNGGRGTNKVTALFLAVLMDRKEWVEWLLQNKACNEIKNRWILGSGTGLENVKVCVNLMTYPFNLAATLGSKPMLDIFLRAGYDPFKSINPRGHDVFYSAINTGQIEAIKHLIKSISDFSPYFKQWFTYISSLLIPYIDKKIPDEVIEIVGLLLDKKPDIESFPFQSTIISVIFMHPELYQLFTNHIKIEVNTENLLPFLNSLQQFCQFKSDDCVTTGDPFIAIVTDQKGVEVKTMLSEIIAALELMLKQDFQGNPTDIKMKLVNIAKTAIESYRLSSNPSELHLILAEVRVLTEQYETLVNQNCTAAWESAGISKKLMSQMKQMHDSTEWIRILEYLQKIISHYFYQKNKKLKFSTLVSAMVFPNLEDFGSKFETDLQTQTNEACYKRSVQAMDHIFEFLELLHKLGGPGMADFEFFKNVMDDLSKLRSALAEVCGEQQSVDLCGEDSLEISPMEYEQNEEKMSEESSFSYSP